MASNDKKTLLKRLSGSAGKGLGSNTGLGTADIVVPKFPELPDKLTPEAARQFREEVERWRSGLQAQLPVPAAKETVVETPAPAPAPEVDMQPIKQEITQINQQITNIYNQLTQIINNYEECCSEPPPTPCASPDIISHPISQTVNAGQDVLFVVQATGSNTLTYQWYKDAVAIGGATTETLELSAVDAGDEGVYTVTVTNSCGSATSYPAQLDLVNDPVAPDYDISVSGRIEKPQNKTYNIVLNAPVAGTIDSFTYKSAAGTATLAVRIDGVNVTSLTGLSLNSVEATSTPSGLNTFTAGQTISIVVTSSVTCDDFDFVLKMTQTP